MATRKSRATTAPAFHVEPPVLGPEDIAPYLEDEAKPKRKMADVLRAARKSYKTVQAYSGKASANNGDAIAQAMQGATPEQAMAAAQSLADKVKGEDAPDVKAKYSHLNAGQRRMNSGNLIRGFVKRGDVTLDEAIAAIAAAE